MTKDYQENKTDLSTHLENISKAFEPLNAVKRTLVLSHQNLTYLAKDNNKLLKNCDDVVKNNINRTIRALESQAMDILSVELRIRYAQHTMKDGENNV